MDRAIPFIHLSDIHIPPGPRERVSGADSTANFRAVIRRIREMNLRPACFIVSGDLTRDGEIESYHLLGDLLDEVRGFGVPIVLALGNHDARVPFRRSLLGEVTADPAEPYYGAHWIGDLRVLVLDSLIPGELGGAVDEVQLQWLAKELTDPAPDGDLIVVHHPPVDRGLPTAYDHLFRLQNADRLAEVLHGRPLLGILSGHTHVSTIGTLNGVPAITAPSTAFLIDPTVLDGPRPLAGAGFNVVTIRDHRCW